MKNIPFEPYAQQTLEQLHGPGVFLSVKDGDLTNVMTIGWGSLSVYWGRPVFIAPVRLSRYTHDLLKHSGVFTVSVPHPGECIRALGYCGTRSGRSGDKFAAAKLTPAPARKVDCPIVAEGWLHYECRVVGQTTLSAACLSEEIDSSAYGDGDYHTLFFGEIVDIYTTP